MTRLALISLSLASLVAVASAQPTPPAKAPPAKAPPAQGAPAPTAERKPAPPPGPPAPAEAPKELGDFAKQLAGTWKCTGQVSMAGNMVDSKATITHRVDGNLNKFWVQSNLTGTVSGPMKLPPIKVTFFTTYDAT